MALGWVAHRPLMVRISSSDATLEGRCARLEECLADVRTRAREHDLFHRGDQASNPAARLQRVDVRPQALREVVWAAWMHSVITHQGRPMQCGAVSR